MSCACEGLLYERGGADGFSICAYLGEFVGMCWSRSDNIQKIGYISPGRWDSHHLHHQRLAALPELAVKKNGERRLTARRVWSRPHHRLRFDSALRSSSQATSSQAQDVQHM